MEGATTKEEKDERIKNAVKFLQDQITDEGTNVHDASLRFTDHLKAITDLVSCLRCHKLGLTTMNTRLLTSNDVIALSTSQV